MPDEPQNGGHVWCRWLTWGCTLAPAAHLVFLGWEVGGVRKILRAMRHEVCFPPKIKKRKVQ